MDDKNTDDPPITIDIDVDIENPPSNTQDIKWQKIQQHLKTHKQFYIFLLSIFIIILIFTVGFLIINNGGIYNTVPPNNIPTDIQTKTSSPTISSTPTPSTSPEPPVSGSFFIISDLHYDILYSRYANKSLFCRFDPPLVPAKKGGTEYATESCVDDVYAQDPTEDYTYGIFGCDSPLTLIYSLVDNMRAKNSRPDFILILGDISSHCAYSLDIVIQMMEEICNIFTTNFPGIPLVISLGNNDVFPHDTLSLEPYNEVITSIADVWESFNILPQETLEQFREYGYYSYQPYPALRIIVLNTLFYFDNWCPTNDTDACDSMEYEPDPGNQFEWLTNELELSRNSYQSVFVMSHVSPGCSRSKRKPEWMVQYTDRFYQIVSQYSDVIKGNFFSHNHRDTFSLILKNQTSGEVFTLSDPYDIVDTSEVIALPPIYSLPAVSPNVNQNPSFRLQSYDVFTQDLIDYTHYYFPLDQLQKGEIHYPIWLKEYSFREAYGQPDMSPSSLLKVFTKLQTDPSILEAWKQYRVISTPLDIATDYDSFTDGELLCSLHSLCNYIRPCVNATAVQ